MESVKLVLRQEICTECGGRSSNNGLSPTDAAECETICPLIVKLPRLMRILQDGEPVSGYEMFFNSLQSSEPAGCNPDLLRALTVLESTVRDPSHKRPAELLP